MTWYGWLYNPWVPPPYDMIPFIPMPYQEELLLYLQDAIYRCNRPNDYERENIAMPKCRETAGSWSVVAAFIHDWQFHGGPYLILSRNKEEVDEPGNMDTPFEKGRHLLRHQPEWLLPEGFEWHKHSKRYGLTNPNGGFIGGDAMSANAGAGGRVKGILFDEFGKVIEGRDYQAWRSCQNTANLKIAVSTPEGTTGKFADLCEGEDGEGRTLIQLDFWKDPRKMQGGSVVNGQATSPWLDECKPGTGKKGAMDKQSFASQVMCSFQDSQVGGYYSEQYNKFHQVRGLMPELGEPILFQIDPGTHFFWLCTQILPCGCYLVFKEKYEPFGDLHAIGGEIQAFANTNYPHFSFEYYGDPAGNAVKSSMQAGKSEFTYLREEFNMHVRYEFMFKIPREEWIDRGILACRSRMTRICPTHKRASLQVDIERCPILHKALSGHYHEKIGRDGKPTGVPDEFHPIEDAADAFKYGPLAKGFYIADAALGRRQPLPRHDTPWMSPSAMRGKRNEDRRRYR